MTVPKMMSAAVLAGPETLEIRKVKTPTPGPEDVLIRVESCAVCSRDVSPTRKPAFEREKGVWIRTGRFL